MDIVKALEEQLRAQIPTCCLCKESIVGVKVYAVFSCLHVVCFQCTGKDFRDRCELCAGTTLLELDYAKLEDIRERLSVSLQSRPKSDFMSYSVAYDCFYELILLIVHPEPQHCPKLLQIPTLPLPPQPPFLKPACDYEEMKWESSVEDKRCLLCQQDPCECKIVTKARELWDCWKCGYAYNYRGSQECEKCGHVRKGEKQRRGGSRTRRRR